MSPQGTSALVCEGREQVAHFFIEIGYSWDCLGHLLAQQSPVAGPPAMQSHLDRAFAKPKPPSGFGQCSFGFAAAQETLQRGEKIAVTGVIGFQAKATQ